MTYHDHERVTCSLFMLREGMDEMNTRDYPSLNLKRKLKYRNNDGIAVYIS